MGSFLERPRGSLTLEEAANLDRKIGIPQKGERREGGMHPQELTIEHKRFTFAASELSVGRIGADDVPLVENPTTIPVSQAINEAIDALEQVVFTPQQEGHINSMKTLFKQGQMQG